MDTNFLAKDLPTQTLYPIEWLKAQRQENRAFVDRTYEGVDSDRALELTLNRVPAVVPGPWLNAEAVGKARRVFDCHVWEARGLPPP